MYQGLFITTVPEPLPTGFINMSCCYLFELTYGLAELGGGGGEGGSKYFCYGRDCGPPGDAISALSLCWFSTLLTNQGANYSPRRTLLTLLRLYLTTTNLCLDVKSLFTSQFHFNWLYISLRPLNNLPSNYRCRQKTSWTY